MGRYADVEKLLNTYLTVKDDLEYRVIGAEQFRDHVHQREHEDRARARPHATQEVLGFTSKVTSSESLGG